MMDICFQKSEYLLGSKSLDPDPSSAMNMPSTKLQRKPARTAERARTQVARAAECGAAASGLQLKGGGSDKKIWSDII
jgi:hypothetical protein